MSKQLIALLARQRCGTNALRAVIDTHPEIQCYEEVLNGDEHYLKHDWSYFRFVHDNFKIDEYLPVRQPEIFGQFIDHLHSLHDKPKTLVDLKLNTCCFIGSRFVNFSSPPVFDWLHRNRAKVIHLKRDNFLRIAFSIELAEARGVWHDQEKKAQTPAPAKVSLEHFDAKWLPTFRLWKLEDEIVERNFIEGRLELEYGDMYPKVNSPISERTLEQLSEFLDVSNDFSTETWCSKSAKLPLREAIANWQEICSHLKGTENEFMLEDEPMYHGVSEIVADDSRKFRLETATALLSRITA